MPVPLRQDPLARAATATPEPAHAPEAFAPDGPPPFAPRPVDAAASIAIPPHPSPAREMIAGLEQALAAPEAGLADEARWPARRTLIFVLVTCGAFWAGFAAAIGLAL